MGRLSDIADKNHQKMKKIGLLDPDNSTIVNDSQTTAINAYMIVANICFTIAVIYIMGKYNDMQGVALIVVGVCSANMAAKIIANAVQKHDMMISIAANLRNNYEKEKEEIIKEQTSLVKKFKTYNKPIYSDKQLEKFKEEVHKAALEKVK